MKLKENINQVEWSYSLDRNIYLVVDGGGI